MSVSAARFELALKELKPSDWERFERLCSVFLASDYPGLRTMASPGGDRGRDAELYSVEDEPKVLFQYAVREDWDQKIKETLKRTKKEFPEATAVVFMSNQQIGAKADAVKRLARAQAISLDVCDRSWFLERLDSDDSRRNGAAELARVIVDPLLAQSGIIQSAPGLKGQEARTALVFLELQAKDNDAGRGLTKSCYDSLVKAALQGTSSENRMQRRDVHDKIHLLLPQHSASQLAPFVDAALKRLAKAAVKHYPRQDEFHISYDEVERTKDRVAGLALLQKGFLTDVHDIVHLALKDDQAKISLTQTLLREILETYFYKLGEEFAQSVNRGNDIPLHTDMLQEVVRDLSPFGMVDGGKRWVDFLYYSVKSLIASPSTETIELFRVLSTAYTLFAFLAEVPDVQKATKKLFEHGNIWFDTTVLLPLFAEQAFPDDMRPFSDLMQQLRRTGLKLWVTAGVVEEIEGHLNLCKAFLRTSNWVGRVPYVYQRYALAGGTSSHFVAWLEQFLGDHRPIDDLAVFLRDSAGIEVSPLPSWDALAYPMVEEIRRYWQSIQDKRRRGPDGVGLNAIRLAEHDTENYISVLAQRHVEPGKSIIGYTSWLLTLDSAAWRLINEVNQETYELIKHSPVISLDFLLRYLSFGPRRDRVDSSKKGYSRIFASTIFESIPSDLIAVAQQVRDGCHGLTERLVQRRIRDELDKQRMKAGDVQAAGLDGVDTAIMGVF